jgi:hypothetical protein
MNEAIQHDRQVHITIIAYVDIDPVALLSMHNVKSSSC